MAGVSCIGWACCEAPEFPLAAAESPDAAAGLLLAAATSLDEDAPAVEDAPALEDEELDSARPSCGKPPSESPVASSVSLCGDKSA